MPVADLAQVREQYRDKTIVLCHGAFDLVHMGHLIHFEEARALGDMLVVTITADRHITKKRSVSFNEDYRARQVASLEIVDYVAIVDEPSAVAALESLKPDIYVKGPEYSNLLLDKTSNISHEKALVESYGGRIHFTSGETFSSTKLSHFLLASSEAVQDNPLLRNDRVMFRDVVEPSATRSRTSRAFLTARGGPSRVPPRRDDHRRVGGRPGRPTSRRNRGASPASRPRACARSAAPASSRCTWPVS